MLEASFEQVAVMNASKSTAVTEYLNQIALAIEETLTTRCLYIH